MYISEIIWLLMWPVVIIVSYFLIVLAFKKYQAKYEKEEENPV
ncbi:MAG TPA: hypothetical protein VE912_00980 [Bacteroidales bacterium]|nr:hypothetical protein [Bacteroidales bacterium]